MLPLRAFLISSVAISFIACDPPESPNVRVCAIDYASDEALCRMSKESGLPVREPLANLDRGIGFAPLEWEKIQNYIDLMKAYIENNCR